MAGVLHHRIKHSEEMTRNAMYRFLFNAGFQAMAFLAVLIILLVLMSKVAS
jgi:hypothetical protein